MSTFIQQFVAFVKNFGVLGLAIGVVIGQATLNIVNSLVANIITPIIGIIFAGVDFSELAVTVGESEIKYGQFISDLINFLVIVFLVYAAIKVVIGRFLSEKEREKIGL